MRTSTALLLTLSLALPACATGQPPGTYVRDTDDPTVDEPAMSTGLDKRDLERMFLSLASDLMQSRFYARHADTSPRATVAIAPFQNDTTEHIDPQLDALLSKVETQILRDGGFAVVSRERQREVLAEVHNQQQSAFDPREAARFGRLVGARYVITGKVYDAAERTLDMRRVQYMAFMQAIEVETGVVHWQAETDVTKAYVAGL